MSRRRGATWRWRRAAMGGLVAAMVYVRAVAQSPVTRETPLEYQVKAAFLLNFARFVEWPEAAFEGPDAPMVFCVVRPDPFGDTLDDILEGELVNGRKVEVHRIADPLARKCHVLFAESGHGRKLAKLPPFVLGVGEGKECLREGAAIAFVREARRVRFEINQAAATKAGLKISSRLLSIARPLGE